MMLFFRMIHSNMKMRHNKTIDQAIGLAYRTRFNMPVSGKGFDYTDQIQKDYHEWLLSDPDLLDSWSRR